MNELLKAADAMRDALKQIQQMAQRPQSFDTFKIDAIAGHHIAAYDKAREAWQANVNNACTCPGFWKGGVWFPMIFANDCPTHGRSLTPDCAESVNVRHGCTCGGRDPDNRDERVNFANMAAVERERAVMVAGNVRDHAAPPSSSVIPCST